MGTRRWDFRDDYLHRYVVELEDSFWTAKRLVRVNAREVLRTPSLSDPLRELLFAAEGQDFRIGVRRAGLGVTYDLTVNGQPVAPQGTVVRARQGEAGPAEAAAASEAAPVAASEPAPEPVAAPEWLEVKGRRDNGGRWFYWIAGLSLLNAVLFLLGSDWAFVVGSALGFVLQGIAAEFVDEGISWLAHLPVVAVFAWFGLLALGGRGWAFLVGAAIYALDAVLVLVLIEDWIGLAFHGFALFAIVNGWRAQLELDRMAGAPSPATAQ